MSLGTIGQKNLEQALANSLSPSLYQGLVRQVDAIDTSLFDDTVGGFAINQWAGYSLQFSPYTQTLALRGVWLRISSNTGASLQLEMAPPAVPQPGDQFMIRAFSGIGAAAKDTTPSSGNGILGFLSGLYRAAIGGLGAMQARAPGLSGTVPADGVHSTFSISLGKLGGQATYANGVFDARLVTIGINNMMQGQAITAASLVLSDAINFGPVVSITYPLSGVNVAYGSTATFLVLLDRGLYNNVSLNVTFSGVPAGGNIWAMAYVQGAGAAQMSLSGSNLIASGKKTDADATDKTIPTAGFNRVMLDCSDCTKEMTFTADEAIAGAVKPVYVKVGATLDVPIKGATLHYSGAGTFRYILL